MQKKFGAIQAKKIQNRLDDIFAAETLEDFRSIFPGRCHELKGDRKGHISLDVVHPYRLLFRASESPPPSRTDGGLDWDSVHSVTIIEVVDTHG